MPEPLTLDDMSQLDRTRSLARERLGRAVYSLELTNIPYAVIGGCAVDDWMKRAGHSGAHTRPNIDLLIVRAHLDLVKTIFEGLGWFREVTAKPPTFLDSPNASKQSGVRLYFADTFARENDVLPFPSLENLTRSTDGLYSVIALETLVEMKLVAHRTIDRVHIQDLASVNLIDATWPERFPTPLRERLAAILAMPCANYYSD